MSATVRPAPPFPAAAADALRQADGDLHAASLFMPLQHRWAVTALFAFAAEAAGMRLRITDPLAGQIRLTWWIEVLSGGRGSDAAGHPVAAPLLAAIVRYGMPAEALIRIAEAGEATLFPEPPPTLIDLEGRLGETASATLRLAMLILADGGPAGGGDAPGHAGVAVGMANLAADLPLDASRGRLTLPADLMDRHAVDPGDIHAGRATPALAAALAELRSHAEHHVAAAHRALIAVPAAVRPALLPLSLVSRRLALLVRRRDPLHDVIRPEPLRRLLTLAAARRRWRRQSRAGQGASGTL